MLFYFDNFIMLQDNIEVGEPFHIPSWQDLQTGKYRYRWMGDGKQFEWQLEHILRITVDTFDGEELHTLCKCEDIKDHKKFNAILEKLDVKKCEIRLIELQTVDDTCVTYTRSIPGTEFRRVKFTNTAEKLECFHYIEEECAFVSFEGLKDYE